MTDQRPEEVHPSAEIVEEVRTRRLVIVDHEGVEKAVVELAGEVVEIRVGGSRASMPCEVLIFAGEYEPGLFSAGLELWANGDSVAGQSVTVAGKRVEVRSFEL